MNYRNPKTRKIEPRITYSKPVWDDASWPQEDSLDTFVYNEIDADNMHDILSNLICHMVQAEQINTKQLIQVLRSEVEDAKIQLTEEIK